MYGLTSLTRTASTFIEINLIGFSEIVSPVVKAVANWFQYDLNYRPFPWQMDLLPLDYKTCFDDVQVVSRPLIIYSKALK